MVDLMVVSLAAVSGGLAGWLTSRIRTRRRNSKKLDKLNHRYFKGLNYLLNDESDKAIDVFIKLAETSQETFEPQLALGNLYRRKGEVDRAIRLHQSLISQPNLPESYRTRALLAIGKDYMSAGLLDRAEVLFSELVEIEAHTPEALMALCDIYQQEQDWLEAIRTSTRYEAVSGRSMQVEVSHFYCEIADQSLLEGHVEKAVNDLNSALRVDPCCVRAHLSFAAIHESNKAWDKAIDSYHQAIACDATYLPEFINRLAECYRQQNDLQRMEADFLKLAEEYHGVSLILTLAEHYLNTRGVDFASEYIEQQLQKRASIKGLNALIELNLSRLEESEREQSHYNVLHNLIDQLLQNKPNLRCRKCGFGAQSLHWQCPSCKSWSTVKPIYGLDSE